MNNARIVAQLKSGNIEAFADAFHLYYEPLCIYAHTILQRQESAEDAVQDSFARLCSKPELWYKIDDIRGYLYITVKNRCMVLLRQRTRNENLTSIVSSHFQKEEYISLGEQNDRVGIVSKIVSTFPQRRRLAMSLVYVNGKTYKQAAQLLGVKIDTIKKHLSLGRQTVRSILRKQNMFTVGWLMLFMKFNLMK